MDIVCIQVHPKNLNSFLVDILDNNLHLVNIGLVDMLHIRLDHLVGYQVGKWYNYKLQ